ncbi:hypothetical protein PRIPAC_76499 [Pristionchus pacificus]|uniref:Uncharacterized protein n=1 Tax=Pristionchus pacificus TaxID=54126 RepID=A0A2A6C5S5_PRIPA|nr:hypothetical protein PRIPAC_76499 [Pristionchus pacificus]|eukprot:PDM73457.1 hypothetical protein PRIPAC_40813 [Pristionchus pacificus]
MMLLRFIVNAIMIATASALYFPNAAVITRRDVGRQLSLNLTGTFLAFAAYDYVDIADDSYAQRVRVVSSGLTTTVFNLSTSTPLNGGTGPLIAATLTSPITIVNDNIATSLNETDFVLYFVRSNVTPPFPVYTLQNGSISVTADSVAHGVTILNAKPSLMASTFSLKSIPTVRVASCGFDSATNDDYAVLDITAQRQSFSFHILNGPIATFYDPKASNGSFSFALNEATTLDRKVPAGAEFTITSAGFATVKASYNTLTQIVIDAADFRDREWIRFIASGSKTSVDVSLNTTADTIYQPDTTAATLALTVTADDPSHAPRFRIKIVSGPSSSLGFIFTTLLIAISTIHNI